MPKFMFTMTRRNGSREILFTPPEPCGSDAKNETAKKIINGTIIHKAIRVFDDYDLANSAYKAEQFAADIIKMPPETQKELYNITVDKLAKMGILLNSLPKIFGIDENVYERRRISSRLVARLYYATNELYKVSERLKSDLPKLSCMTPRDVK